MKRLLPASLLVFVVSAFALPTEAAFSLVFYVCVMPLVVLKVLMPAGLHIGCRAAFFPIPLVGRAGVGVSAEQESPSCKTGTTQRTGWKAPPSGVLVALALILWSGLTLLWGESSGDRSLRFLLATAATATFVLALSNVLSEAVSRRRLATMLICAGAANAAFVLLLNAPNLLHCDRILGWGITRQPILGGSVIAAACLTAMSRCKTPVRKTPLPRLREREGRSPKGREGEGSQACKTHRRRSPISAATLLYGSASLLMAAFVLAMQSRGALLGLAGGATVIALTHLRIRTLAATASIAALLCVALPGGAKHLLDRGTSHRLEIWSQTLTLIQEKPLLGHGLAANLPFSPTGFPHSLYLSLLFYSGVIGFTLFVTLATLVSARLLRAAGPERDWMAALWVNALLAGFTDFGQITKGPGPLWFILWLPIVLALTLPVTPPAAAEALPSATR
jgi:hypothetical protein